MSSSLNNSRALLLLLLSIITLSIVEAKVPQNATFQYVNEGEFGPYIIEYNGNYRPLPISNSPFQLFFYNTTSNAFTLAIRMGTQRSESLRRFVWEANRGNPVGENATLTFGADGNLVLAEADGRVAWQTNTANKGVVGLELLPNGNMVLHDSNGRFVWQSFDYPTDTILVGQALRAGAQHKLVSRLSETENKNGPYSMVLEPKRLALYYTTKNSPTPLLYYDFSSFAGSSFQNPPTNLTLEASSDSYDGFAYDMSFISPNGAGGYLFTRPNYNSTLSFLRLGIDGNVKMYTYYDKVDWRGWEVTFILLDREMSNGWESECLLPGRCGTFGVCENDQCVACPSENGLLGWSKNCEPKKLKSCKPSDFHFYKIEGVDHFLSKYTKGSSVKESECGNKCTSDCKCLGYFYHKQASRCWIAYDLMTLTKVDNSTHVGYIKTPN
ncbi:epidermis-specific secreted glycoprotein EP1-like [Humulus lupulus]|uniref:epidermis-specific secreted glycoprotein EP1-like n=1 Tax=Humulus lupulus TaxID=3486 RepID=UPI002B41213A|nr:epidermis-specific secreted glycoprotein EP1-like [Humulus lupulus]